MSKRPTAVFTAATGRAYLARGWDPFPVWGGEKGTHDVGITGYAGRPITDADMVEWDGRPCNTAVRLRHDQIGVDVDGYAGADLEALEARLGPLPPTVITTSREDPENSGIRHFRLPAEYAARALERVWVDRLGPHIEVVRFAHRHAMVWPSIHPKHQGLYRVYDQRTDSDTIGPLPPAAGLPLLPVAWCEALIKPARASQPGGDQAADAFWTPGRPCRTVAATLEAVLADLPNGRHDGMTRGLVRLARHGEQGHRGTEAAREQLYEAFMGEVGDERGRDPESEWERAVQGAEDEVERDGWTPVANRGCCDRHEREESEWMNKLPTALSGRTDSHLVDWLMGNGFGESWSWSPGLGWLRYDGRRWVETPSPVVVSDVKHRVQALIAAEAKAGADREVLDRLVRLLSKSRLTAVVELSRGEPGVFVRDDQLNAHPDLLNVGNGTVNLATGELLPHDPRDLITRITEVDYIESATHPDWNKALEAVTPDTLDWLQLRLGQAATGYPPPDDVVLVLRGDGENGKTTFLGTVLAVMGEHALTMSSKVLLAASDAHSTELTDLFGVRLAVHEEMPDRLLNTKRLKDITQPTMTARRIRQDDIHWNSSHTVIVSSNYALGVNDTDHGTWRRLAMVQFTKTFTGAQRDRGLRERVRSGKPAEAVLAWIVAGAQRWYVGGRDMPPMPPSVAAATAAWRGEVDTVGEFIRDWLVADPAAMIASQDLLRVFNAANPGAADLKAATLKQRLLQHPNLPPGMVPIRARDRADGTMKLSRPRDAPWTVDALPPQFMAWTGVRFGNRSDQDE